VKRKNKFVFQNKRFLAFSKNELSYLFLSTEKYYAGLAFSSLSKKCNRCFLTGSSRSFFRIFGLSRQAFREKALHGFLPGVRKSSF